MTDPDLFEMRRLESLSNTIFGVAMTLLAYDLLKTGEFKAMPTWSDLNQLYSSRIGGLVLSFIIAALFPILVLVPGTIVAGIAPQYASYLWLLAFGALLIRRVSGSPSPSS